MKKLILLLIPFLIAAAPSRVSTYVSGTTISSTAVTANEDALFNYVQTGVDTIKDGSIINADLSASAAIAASKLNLTTIAQPVSFTTIPTVGTITTGIISGIDLNGGAIDGVIIGGSSPKKATFSGIEMTNYVSEFSTDGTLGGNSDQAVPTEKAVKTYVDANIFAPVYVAGDILVAHADTERTSADAAYTKYKEITVTGSGTLRVKFDLKNDGSNTCYGRVYRDGVAVGTEQLDNTGAYVTKSEDIAGWTSGDKIQLYLKKGTSTQSNAKNFRLYTNGLNNETIDTD